MLNLNQILYRIQQQDVNLEMKIERGQLTSVAELQRIMYDEKNLTGNYLAELTASLNSNQAEIFTRLSAMIDAQNKARL